MGRPTNESAERRSRSAGSDELNRADILVGERVESRQDRRSELERLRGVLGGAGRVVVRWRFFLGACLLTGALLLPYVKTGPVLSGMVLAGLVQFAWYRINSSSDRHR